MPFPSPGDLPDPGIGPRSPAMEADALTSEPPGMQPEKPVLIHSLTFISLVLLSQKQGSKAKFSVVYE